MKLTLCSVGNPDFGQYAPPSPRLVVEVDSFEKASVLARDYIDAHDLGGGNWGRQSGILRDRGKVVGCVSYNGRVWPPGAVDDSPNAALPDPLYDPRKALPRWGTGPTTHRTGPRRRRTNGSTAASTMPGGATGASTARCVASAALVPPEA